uniref:Uncharacterized protein n=1 Tax=Arundo donax TaxID=35708 RepID=A0A0A9DKN4_ARUDO
MHVSSNDFTRISMLRPKSEATQDTSPKRSLPWNVCRWAMSHIRLDYTQLLNKASIASCLCYHMATKSAQDHKVTKSQAPNISQPIMGIASSQRRCQYQVK